MEIENLVFLCMSVRGSERVASQAGKKLDRIAHVERGFISINTWFKQDTPSEVLDSDRILSFHHATGVMTDQFKKIFSQIKSIRLSGTHMDLKLDGVSGCFEAIGCVAMLSTSAELECVEGDDSVFIITLRASQNEPKLDLFERPKTQKDAVELLKKIAVLPKSFNAEFSNTFRSGFYLISAKKLVMSYPDYDSSWIKDGFSEASISYSMAVGYMFYCYLVCQRLERLLLNISANGDWDDEYRKLILARKKLIAARKSALIKNRASPNSPLLMHFLATLPVFRLPEQLDYLSIQADETSKVMESQNNYTSAKRIQSIELIIFVSTILGLAVAINAIQMAPFFDQNTSNALQRPIFWIVTISVITAGVLLWGVTNHWRNSRRLWRWLSG